MKKVIILLIAIGMGVSSFANDFIDIDKRIVRSFKMLFPNAQEVNWYERSETYEVHFIENETRTRITYWKNGMLVQFLRHYQERNLPAYIQFRIKKEYPDKSIFGITELSTIAGLEKNVKVEYNIKLVDDDYWWLVRLDTDGNLKVVEKFAKAY